MKEKFQSTCDDIEAIEFHTDNYFVEDEHDKYPNYAYVTFRDSQTVHRALIKNDFPFDVQPANTWKQPPVVHKSTGTNYFDMLDDYCILHIFSYNRPEDLIELAEVSQRFQSLVNVKQLKNQKKHLKEMTLNCQPSKKNTVSLVKIRRLLRAYGKHLEKLTLILPKATEKTDLMWKRRIVDLFTKYMGDKLMILNVHNLVLNDRLWLQFKTLFRHVDYTTLSGGKMRLGHEAYLFASLNVTSRPKVA